MNSDLIVIFLRGVFIVIVIFVVTKLIRRKPQQFQNFQARFAARSHLPVWLALLMPLTGLFLTFTLTFLCLIIFEYIHFLLHPIVKPFHFGFSDLLIFISSVLTSIIPALMLGNIIFSHVPPIKLILEQNAQNVPGASYNQSMQGLKKAILILVPIGITLSLIGAFELWKI
jgi:hypothetical protein